MPERPALSKRHLTPNQVQVPVAYLTGPDPDPENFYEIHYDGAARHTYGEPSMGTKKITVAYLVRGQINIDGKWYHHEEVIEVTLKKGKLR